MMHLEEVAGGEAKDWTPEQISVLKQVASQAGVDPNIFINGKDGTPEKFVTGIYNRLIQTCSSQDEADAVGALYDQLKKALSLK